MKTTWRRVAKIARTKLLRPVLRLFFTANAFHPAVCTQRWILIIMTIVLLSNIRTLRKCLARVGSTQDGMTKQQLFPPRKSERPVRECYSPRKSLPPPRPLSTSERSKRHLSWRCGHCLKSQVSPACLPTGDRRLCCGRPRIS